MGLTLSGRGARARAGIPPAAVQITVHQPGGLTHGLAQTSDGFVWLATERGLLRFDGLQFVGLPGLPTDEPVDQLAADGGGGLWFLTRSGELVYQRGASRDALPAARLPRRSSWALALDEQDRVWLAASDQVGRIDAGLWVSLSATAGWGRDERVRRFWRALDGTLWLETSRAWRPLSGRSARQPVLKAFEDQDPDLATVASLLFDEAGRQALAPVLDELRKKFVGEIRRDGRGRVWIALGDFLLCLDGTRSFRLGAADGLPENQVRFMMDDREGNLWVVTNGRGLAQIVSHPVAAVTTRHGIAGPTPFGLTQTPDGVVWVTTAAGLSRVHGDEVTNRAPPHGRRQQLRTLVAGADGHLWVGSLDPELLDYDPAADRFTTLPLPEGRALEMISAMAFQGDELVIATAYGRLLAFRQGRFRILRSFTGCERTMNEHPTFCAGAVASMVPRQAGGLWLVTMGSGVWSLRGDELRQAAVPAMRPDQRLWSADEDPDGTLWLGSDAGLFRWRPPEPPVSLAATGRLSEVPVFQVVGDDADHLWYGGLRGLVRVAKSALRPGERPGPPPQRFTVEDGLPTDMAMVLFEPSVLRAADRRLWFTTSSGLAVVDPSTLASPRPPAAPAIEEVHVAGETWRYPRVPARLALAAGQGDVTITYTAPAFTSAHQVRFRHRLEGLDTDWTRPSNRRQVQFAHLRPGFYLFRVQAFREDNPGLTVETSLAIQLAPHFYQTGSFAALVAIAALSLFAGVVSLRTRSVRRRFELVLEERHRIARDLHDNLAQIFSALGFQIDSLLQIDGDSARPLTRGLQQLRKMVVHGRRSSRAVIWNLRSGGGQAGSLDRALRELTGLFNGAAVSLTVTGAPYPLPLPVETETLSIAEQAVSNAIEHGRAHHVGIEVEYAPSCFSLWVRDDGEGFRVDDTEGSGFGLRAMRERAARAGGTLVVESAPGVGTEVEFTLTRRGERKGARR